MSCNVLVIPEDFRTDQYVLKPIVDQMLRSIGLRPSVRVCQRPLLGGVREALKWERLAEIVDSYRGMVDVFLLIVDRDGDPGRRQALDGIEAKAREALDGTGRLFLAQKEAPDGYFLEKRPPERRVIAVFETCRQHPQRRFRWPTSR